MDFVKIGWMDSNKENFFMKSPVRYKFQKLKIKK